MGYWIKFKEILCRLHTSLSWFPEKLPWFVFLFLLYYWIVFVRWYEFYPPIGTYIAVLTLFGVLLTVNPPESRWEKRAWVIVFGLFVIFEIHTLYKEKMEYITQQKSVNENFNAITKNLKDTSDTLREILENEKKYADETKKRFTNLIGKQEDLFSRQEKLAMATLEKVKEREGALIPSNLPSPITTCNVPKGKMAVYFAGGAAWDMRFPFSVFNVRGRDIISLDSNINGDLFISADIFDDRGDLVVRIEDNNFHATYAASLTKKTPNSLTVFDHKGDQVFLVRFNNPFAYEIEGDFYSREGYKIKFDSQRLLIGTNEFRAFCVSNGKGFLKVE